MHVTAVYVSEQNKKPVEVNIIFCLISILLHERKTKCLWTSILNGRPTTTEICYVSSNQQAIIYLYISIGVHKHWTLAM